MSNLIVVESPTKVRTIKRFLPEGYNVLASYGHVKDLPKSEMGVDIEDKTFEPKYVVAKGKEKRIADLKKKAKGTKHIIIATDPDREGEAIGWHVARSLGLITEKGNTKKGKGGKLSRVVFHEITKPAVLEALEHPRDIDMSLVDAQQARRVLDRLVGYTLSPLLWKKIRFGLSAGRVQSVALRLVVDRERERDDFKPEEYWSLEASCGLKKEGRLQIKIEKRSEDKKEEKKKNSQPNDQILFELHSYKGKKTTLSKEHEAQKVIDAVKDKEWKVSDIKEKETKRNPSPPFTTSTLQQTAVNKFGYTSRKTMSVAQKLYEAGFITYMRTDSLSVSPVALKQARAYVKKTFGDEYLSKDTRVYKTKSKSAQEAHEAIRPTKVSNTSDILKLKGDQKRLYDLIWQRAVATQMKEARVGSYTIEAEINSYLFRSTFTKVHFDGYMKVYKVKTDEKDIPPLKKGDEVFPSRISGIQHFTQPPARYSEASLIKALEAHGIGRPSTYSNIISTILGRGYVEKDQRYLVPTDTGKVVVAFLTDNFEEIMDLDFTAEMEDSLDDIAKGEKDWHKLMKDFYSPFAKTVKEKTETIKRKDYLVLEKSDEKCPECGKKMVVKLGRYGRFLSCSNFPECKGMKALEIEGEPQEDSEEFKKKYSVPPKTDDGRKYELKRGRYGQFWAHPDYPKVKDAQPLLLKEKCPECGKNLVERQGKWKQTFIGCSGYPDCKYIKKVPKKKEDS